MFLKSFRNFLGTLAFRLALWYTIIFTVSSIAAISVCYIMIVSVVKDITDTNLREEFKEFAGIYDKDGIEGVITKLEKEALEEDLTAECFRLLTSDGDIVASTDMNAWNNIGPSKVALKELREGKDHYLESLSLSNREDRVRLIYSNICDGYVFQYGKSLQEESKFIAVFERIFMVALAIMMLIAAMAGWFMSRKALRGVEEITQTTIEIKGGSLEKRVAVKSRGYEIETLALTFNEMLDHIETLIREMRQLTDNIAHDLRNRITSLRLRAELALISDPPKENLESVTSLTIEECDSLLQMINSMLDLVEADSGALKLELEDIKISRLIMDAVEIFEPLAEEKRIEIINEVPIGLTVKADRQGLQRIVANLLDNAIKYTPENGEVRLSASSKNGMVEILIADSGIGISKNDLHKIFKRYYRSDKSRSTKGIGLGLSLARAIARACHGDVSVVSSLDQGSSFTITLPN